MGLGNAAVEEHMNGLFGQIRADQLSERLKPLNPQEQIEKSYQKRLSGLYTQPMKMNSLN